MVTKLGYYSAGSSDYKAEFSQVTLKNIRGSKFSFQVGKAGKLKRIKAFIEILNSGTRIQALVYNANTDVLLAESNVTVFSGPRGPGWVTFDFDGSDEIDVGHAQNGGCTDYYFVLWCRNIQGLFDFNRTYIYYASSVSNKGIRWARTWASAYDPGSPSNPIPANATTDSFKYAVYIEYDEYSLPETDCFSPTNIAPQSATFEGDIDDAGNQDNTERGFVYGLSDAGKPASTKAPGSTSWDDYVSETGSFDEGLFDINVLDLSPDTRYYYRAYSKNDIGYGYSDTVVSFETLALVSPNAETLSANNIGQEGARLRGRVDDDGGEACSEVGFVWGQSSHGDPGTTPPEDTDYSYYNFQEGAFVSEDQFYRNLQNLTPNTTYYFRAFVRNGIAYDYGAEFNFKTLSGPPTAYTRSVDNITSTSGRLRGRVTSDGGEPCDYGFVWDTSSHSNPGDVAPGASGYANDWQGAGTVESEDTFSHTISSLTAGVKIYVRSWLENPTGGYDYGSERSFTPTLTVPSVSGRGEILAANDVTILGRLDATGGADVTKRGFAWGEASVGSPSQSPPFGYDDYYEDDGEWDDGDMPSDFSKFLRFSDNPGFEELKKHTIYYWIAFGYNTEGYGFSSEDSLVSDVVVPSIRTDPATSVEKTTCTFNGYITANGGELNDKVGFIYDTNSIPEPGNTDPSTLGVQQIEESGSFDSEESFDAAISGLTSGVTYHVRAYGHNSAGWAYGEDYEFTTGIDPPIVITADATLIGGSSAKLNGQITDVGGENCDVRGFVYGTSSHPGTFDENTDPDSTGYTAQIVQASGPYAVGAFAHTPTLQEETTYYFRAFSHNSGGYGWGTERSFRTLALPPTAPYPDADNIETDTWGGLMIVDPDQIWSDNEYVFLVDALTIRPGLTDKTGVFMVSINDNAQRDKSGKLIHDAFQAFTYIKDRDPVHIAVQRGTSTGAWDPTGGTDEKGAGREVLLGGYVMQRFWSVDEDGRITANIIGVDYMHAWKKIPFGSPQYPRDYETSAYRDTGGVPIWGTDPIAGNSGMMDQLISDVNLQISDVDVRSDYSFSTHPQYFTPPTDATAENNRVFKKYNFDSAFDVFKEVCDQLELKTAPQLGWDWTIDYQRRILWWPRKGWESLSLGIPLADAPINYETNIREVPTILRGDSTDISTHIIVTDAENDLTLPSDIDALCYTYRMWDERGGTNERYKSQGYDANSVPGPSLGFPDGATAPGRKAVDRTLVVDDEGHPAVCFMKDDWEDRSDYRYRHFVIEANLHRSGEDWLHSDLRCDLQKYRRVRFKFRVPNMSGYGYILGAEYRLRLHWNEKTDEFFYYDFGKGIFGPQMAATSSSYDPNSLDSIPDGDWVWIDLALPKFNRDGTKIEKTNGWGYYGNPFPNKEIHWCALDVKVRSSSEWATPIGPHALISTGKPKAATFIDLDYPGLFIGNKDSEQFDTFNAPGPKAMILGTNYGSKPNPNFAYGATEEYITSVNTGSDEGNTGLAKPLGKKATVGLPMFARAGWAVCFSQFHFIKTLTTEKEDTATFRPPYSYEQIYSKESETLADVGDITNAFVNEQARAKSYAEIKVDGDPRHKIGYGVQVNLEASGFNNVKLPIDDIEYVVDGVDFYTKIRLGNLVRRAERTESSILDAHSRNIKDISVQTATIYNPEAPPE